jgi:hypothetical protein
MVGLGELGEKAVVVDLGVLALVNAMYQPIEGNVSKLHQARF